MNRLFYTLLTCIFLLGCASSHTFTYRNPISKGIQKGGLRDCQVFNENGKWYMTGTCYPVWRGANPGVALYSSINLTEWKFEKYLIERSKLDSSVWYYDRFWAPEIHKIKNKYYLLFNSRNETREFAHERGTCVAVSDKLCGEYKVLNQDKPFSKGIDLSFFEDNDGKVYANWHEDDYIMCSEVDMVNMRPINPHIALSPDSGSWDTSGIEGSYVIRDKDTYYMFYSSWSRGYEIGYAVSSSPNGPWKKSEMNPIYGAQDRAVCKKYGNIYSGNDKEAFKQIGHNSAFKDPKGNYWLSCHGIIDNGDPLLVLEPFKIKGDHIIISKPNTKKRTIKW